MVQIPSILPLRRLNDALPEGQKMFDFDEEKWAAMDSQISEVSKSCKLICFFSKVFLSIGRFTTTKSRHTIFSRSLKVLLCPRKFMEEKFCLRFELRCAFLKMLNLEEKVSGQLCLEFMENSCTMNFYTNHSVDQIKQV